MINAIAEGRKGKSGCAVESGRILILPPTWRQRRSADLRSGAFLGDSQYLPGRRPALRGQCQDAPVESSEVRILHAALGVILQADEQMAPRHVAEMAMVAAAFPAAMTEFQQHLVVLRFEDEFLRRADPVRRAAPGALPAHK